MSPFWLADFAKSLAPWISLAKVFVFFYFRDLSDGFEDDFSICHNLFLPTGLYFIIENAVKKKHNTRRPCASMPLDHIMSQMNTVHVLPNHYLDNYSNITPKFTPRSLK